MGQKVSPVGLRIGVNKDWDSKWFASKQDYATYLHEDIKIRELISNTPKFKDAVVSKVEIEKTILKDDVFGENTVDYSVNIMGVGEVFEVELPDIFTVKTLENGNKCIYDANGLPTKIKEENGNLVIFSDGEWKPIFRK
jgi:hypothetical protein